VKRNRGILTSTQKLTASHLNLLHGTLKNEEQKQTKTNIAQ